MNASGSLDFRSDALIVLVNKAFAIRVLLLGFQLTGPEAGPTLRYLAMADPSPPTGKVLGHYRILGQLGAGGMGVVYSACDTIPERKVAIKVVGDPVLVAKTARDLLLHEARTASSSRSPTISSR